jgi:hypothetical protein
MPNEPLVMACVGDISGQVRGEGFPAAHLARRVARGIGWTPTNIQITCFDTIAPSPYGSFGDVMLRRRFGYRRRDEVDTWRAQRGASARLSSSPSLRTLGLGRFSLQGSGP